MGRRFEPKSGRKIKEVLSPIIGEPLTNMYRVCGHVFEFGERLSFVTRRGTPYESTKLRLKVIELGCAWTVSRESVLIMGTGDHISKRRFYDRKTPPRDPDQRARWAAANQFLEMLKTQSLVVKGVHADDLGALTIKLSRGFDILVFPNAASSADLWYFWNDDGESISVYAGDMCIEAGQNMRIRAEPSARSSAPKA